MSFLSFSLSLLFGLCICLSILNRIIFLFRSSNRATLRLKRSQFIPRMDHSQAQRLLCPSIPYSPRANWRSHASYYPPSPPTTNQSWIRPSS